MPFGVYSEVGRLRRVMVHRPGLEHSRLTPSNAEELLFDDVLWVARAKAEHDMFAEAMRDRGVEVFEVEQRLGQQVLGLEHLDAAVAHRLAGHVMLGLGPRHPQHVVEQQLGGVGRGQAGVFQARPVHHHLA